LRQREGNRGADTPIQSTAFPSFR
jgi:hypothetical protein